MARCKCCVYYWNRWPYFHGCPDVSVCSPPWPLSARLLPPLQEHSASLCPPLGLLLALQQENTGPRTIFRFNPFIFHVGLMQLKFVCFCPDPSSDLRFVCCWRSLLRLQGFSILHDYKNMALSWLYVSDEISSFLFCNGIYPDILETEEHTCKIMHICDFLKESY